MRVLAVFALLALAACSRPATTYAPGVEMNFMRACEPRSTISGLCACVWDKIETEVTPADFTALERLPGPQREAHPLKRQIDGYAMACGTELSREPAPSP